MIEHNMTDLNDSTDQQISDMPSQKPKKKSKATKKSQKTTSIPHAQQIEPIESNESDKSNEQLLKELQKAKESADLYKFMYDEQAELINNLKNEIAALKEEKEKLESQLHSNANAQPPAFLDLSGEPLEPAQVRKILIENNNLRSRIANYEKEIKKLNDRINLINTANSKTYGF